MDIAIINSDYNNWLSELISRVKNTHYKTAIGINKSLILLYWTIGKDIVELQAETKWGSKFFDRLSHDLKSTFPNTNGFSKRNLMYTKQMYLTFCNLNNEFLPQAVAKNNDQFTPQAVAKTPIDYLCLVPWGHIRYILDKHLEPPQAFFYILQTIENGWSRNMLLNFMNADLVSSKGKAINNFSATLPPSESDYATEMLKDPYHLDFLALHKNYKEADLQRALEENITKFLLELGDGFAYLGRQIRLEINGDEFFCDLLFYHLRLRRYIVVELKTGKFEPAFAGQLDFYCNAINHLYCTELDGETIGLLICKEKNDLVAKWTVEKSQQPIAISAYELKKLLERY